MDVAGTAVGIASLGIDVCKGLLSYYDGWKAYKTDISTAYDSIADLCKTFTLLKESLGRVGLDPARAGRVASCLDSCVGGLEKLQKKLRKLQTQKIPSGFRQNAWGELQRSFYPFREKTLAKLRDIVNELRSSLSLALQVLHLDLGAESHHTLTRIEGKIEGQTKDSAAHLIAIGASVAHVSTQNDLLLAGQRADQLKKLVDWLSPPDPWTNHASARRHHETQTGSWFLRSDQYQRWRSGPYRHLWLYGKTGCGKTVLSSTVIEDIRVYCESALDTIQAIFYFSFSDSRKQSFESLLRSLVTQLGRKEPGRLILQREYEKSNGSLPGTKELEEILLSSIGQYNNVFLTLDALDECPENDDTRRDLLGCLERLSQKATNLRILATSRESLDIRECMESLEAQMVLVGTRAVDADIGRYVSSELSRDRKFSRLDEGTKTLIKDIFAEKADGMFRWAYCQLQELKKLKSTKPKYVKTTLLALPTTLDATYERMLTRIEGIIREEALVLLRWLVYAQSPPSLGELAEATIIDPDVGNVDIDNRGGIEDTLEILSGLVTLEEVERKDEDSDEDSEEDDHNRANEDADSGVSKSEDDGSSIGTSVKRIRKDAKLRLAHFSVKEYLESQRVLQSGAKDFYLRGFKEHCFLAQSCLTYLIHYSSSNEKTSTQKDLRAFPLLEYAAQSWFYHSSFQESEERGREVFFLNAEAIKRDWIRVQHPDQEWKGMFTDPEEVGSGLYYASLFGLKAVVKAFLEAGVDVNAQGGYLGNALHAASYNGHEKVVEMLIDGGADINAQGGYYSSALVAALQNSHEKVAEILMDRGADVNAYGGESGNALQAASVYGYEKLVEMLIDKGADINAQGGAYGNALVAASYYGHEKVVEMLKDGGANVNAQGGQFGNALQAALSHGHEKVVQILIDRGADIYAQGGNYGNTLQAASYNGNEKMVEILIKRGIDVNAQGGYYGSALQAASIYGHEKVIQMLIDRGADVNAQGGHYYINTLQAASSYGHEKVVEMLVDRGADTNAQGGFYGNALQAASVNGYEKIVEKLINRGADVNAQGGYLGNALHAASVNGYEKVVEKLINRGANVNAQGGDFSSNALQEASKAGHKRIVEMLIAKGATWPASKSDDSSDGSSDDS